VGTGMHGTLRYRVMGHGDAKDATSLTFVNIVIITVIAWGTSQAIRLCNSCAHLNSAFLDTMSNISLVFYIPGQKKKLYQCSTVITE
jgi:uncharacterized membrane protein